MLIRPALKLLGKHHWNTPLISQKRIAHWTLFESAVWFHWNTPSNNQTKNDKIMIIKKRIRLILIIYDLKQSSSWVIWVWIQAVICFINSYKLSTMLIRPALKLLGKHHWNTPLISQKRIAHWTLFESAVWFHWNTPSNNQTKNDKIMMIIKKPSRLILIIYDTNPKFDTITSMRKLRCTTRSKKNAWDKTE